MFHFSNGSIKATFHPKTAKPSAVRSQWPFLVPHTCRVLGRHRAGCRNRGGEVSQSSPWSQPSVPRQRAVLFDRICDPHRWVARYSNRAEMGASHGREVFPSLEIDVGSFCPARRSRRNRRWFPRRTRAAGSGVGLHARSLGCCAFP